MIKEKREMAILGDPQSSAPVTATVINVQPEMPSVPDHIVWSLFNTLFMNCCLGFFAFAYSVKSRDRKMVGDMVGAQSYASTAKCLNIGALVLGLLLNVGIIIAVVIVCRMAADIFYQSFQERRGY